MYSIAIEMHIYFALKYGRIKEIICDIWKLFIKNGNIYCIYGNMPYLCIGKIIEL